MSNPLAPPLPKPRQPLPPKPVHQLVSTYQASDIISALFVLRFLNALCVNTFFQPDEYFQSLEPAWQIAFGPDSNAWITWEWPHQLRSSLHPMLFGAMYTIVNAFFSFTHAHPRLLATMLVAAPGVFQALFATTTDYFTWKLAERIYGRSSNTAAVAVWISVLSPWQWFCSTRAFSNSLETTLTIAALNFWPWQLSSGERNGWVLSTDISSIRKSLFLAAFACVLRPTNLLIWFSLALITVTRIGLVGNVQLKFNDLVILVREAVLCGSAALAISAASDYVYYGEWTFPAYQWLHFNLAQDLAIFYGRNDWHYYLSQGLPLLLTTYLPFGLYALWSATSLPSPGLSSAVSNARFQLAFSALTMIATLSIISHKEVRFIYPLLPSLHVLAAPHILSYLTSSNVVQVVSSDLAFTSLKLAPTRKRVMQIVVLINMVIAFYTTRVHQRGVLNVMSFLRHEYEAIHLSEEGLLHGGTSANEAVYSGSTHGVVDANETFAAFLMPCHSTPWRSHLVYSSLIAWALTCEPPIHLPANTPARAAYRDEADRFYDDPLKFLREEVNTKQRPWPRYVVGFQGIEPWLREYYESEVPGWKVREKWRGGNSQWHDDWRRQGDVVVWEFVDGSPAALNP